MELHRIRLPNWQIVLNYLRVNPEKHNVVLNNLTFTFADGKICNILYNTSVRDGKLSPPELLFTESDISLNQFIDFCENLSEEEIISLVYATGTIKESIRLSRN